MRKLVCVVAAALPLAFGACNSGKDGGGGGGGGGVVDSTPTQAAVTLNLDPTSIVANHAGNDWYRFKVNLAFSESAGIGFTVKTIRNTLSDPTTGRVYYEDTYDWDQHIAGRGREVLQYTSDLYRNAAGGRIDLDCAFEADISDDNGNSITVSNQVLVSHRGGSRVGIPQ